MLFLENLETPEFRHLYEYWIFKSPPRCAVLRHIFQPQEPLQHKLGYGFVLHLQTKASNVCILDSIWFLSAYGVNKGCYLPLTEFLMVFNSHH